MAAPVFSSDIERIVNPNVTKLYELLHNAPAKPVIPENIDSAVPFQPKAGKFYIPKTKSNNNLKVKTVANIRQQYENDVFSYLPDDLLKIEEFFLSKVSSGSTRLDGSTRRVAKKLLCSSNSIDRQTWQILANLNPEKKMHPLQYVLWNGICVRVNGSRGGNTKFLLNCDLYRKKISGISLNRKSKDPKKSLLQKSLSIKFKPGPLKKKKILDYSYQKFNVGSTELIKLPRIGLEVQPLYGVPIEPTISQVLFSLSSVNERITDKWAEFSALALGEITSSKTSQLETNNVVFELGFKNDQNQILMRSDLRNFDEPYKKKKLKKSKPVVEDDLIISQQISFLVEQMLESVEVNVNQDKSSQYDPDDRITVETDLSLDGNVVQLKDKVKKRCGELEKLDVTVIRLSDVADEGLNKVCEKPFCSFGCVCSSLEYQQKFKNHCGRPDCMFKCNCDIYKQKHNTSLEGYHNILPGLMNLDNEINAKLAKEEQKFHQTVLLTEDKSFVLKPQRRSTKAPKKYSEFFTEYSATNDPKINNIVTIPILKLPCENIEPWCMVHSLYKCFCRGRFTHSAINLADYVSNKITAVSDNSGCPKEKSNKVISTIIDLNQDDSSNTDSDLFKSFANEALTKYDTCARIRRFRGRRYDNYYYEKMHKKIKRLERNDKSLQEKLLKHVKSSLESESNSVLEDQSILETNSESEEAEVIPQSSDLDIETIPDLYIDRHEQNTIPRNMPDMAKLIKWLEENYKFYKPRLQNGQKRFPLEAPKPGKIALYPWEVILDRYQMKKNYFLITQFKPYRLFMAVDLSDPVFKNCIKIDEVKFEDIPKYPITVRNLLQDASDMTDSFYILCGQSNCWELIGHVTKLGANSQDNNNLSVVSGDSEKQVHIEIEVAKYNVAPSNDVRQNEEQCKWFLMLVGNDFKEIQFVYRGFFIKYENIQKAIDVSRLSNKTVRLSSQKSAGFGIHAIPILTHDCVFIGPYNKNESLGFETIGSSESESIKTSKGFWITADKTNNIDLINNPVLFIKNTCENLGNDLDHLVRDLNEIRADVAADATFLEAQPDTSGCNKKRTLTFDGTEPVGVLPLPKLIKYGNVDGIKTEDIIPSTNVIKCHKNDDGTKTDDSLLVPKLITSYEKFHGEDDNLPFPKVIKCHGNFDDTKIDDTIPPPKEIECHEKYDATKTEDLLPLRKVIKCYENRSTFAQSNVKKNTEKVVKPITIKRSGSFYKVAPKAIILKDITKNPSPQSLLKSVYPLEPFEQPSSLPIIQNTFSLKESPPITSVHSKTFHSKPVAEIAPQRKTDLLPKTNPQEQQSESTIPKLGGKNGMMILNPDEINKRLIENSLAITSLANMDGDDSQGSALEDMDVDTFLTTHSVCPPSDEEMETGVLSEEDVDSHFDKEMDVVVECKGYDIGWIPAKINKEYQLSFALPGFKFTEFYSASEAFTKINQVLSRKVYIPKEIELEWEIIYRKHNIKPGAMLKYDIDFKKLLLARKSHNKGKKSSTLPSSTAVNPPSTSEDVFSKMEEVQQEFGKSFLNPAEKAQETTKIIKELEAKSVNLEEQVESLQSLVLLKQSELLKRLMQVPGESRELMRRKIFNNETALNNNPTATKRKTQK